MNNENIAEDPALEEADKEARLEVLKHDWSMCRIY